MSQHACAVHPRESAQGRHHPQGAGPRCGLLEHHQCCLLLLALLLPLPLQLQLLPEAPRVPLLSPMLGGQAPLQLLAGCWAPHRLCSPWGALAQAQAAACQTAAASAILAATGWPWCA